MLRSLLFPLEHAVLALDHPPLKQLGTKVLVNLDFFSGVKLSLSLEINILKGWFKDLNDFVLVCFLFFG